MRISSSKQHRIACNLCTQYYILWFCILPDQCITEHYHVWICEHPYLVFVKCFVVYGFRRLERGKNNIRKPVNRSSICESNI